MSTKSLLKYLKRQRMNPPPSPTTPLPPEVKLICIGELLRGWRLRPRLESGFWKQVKKGTSEECWLWLGGFSHNRYAKISVRGRNLRASRIAFYLTHGRDPVGLICHTCDNPKCVNPGHFFEGTQKDNVDDAERKGRRVKNHEAIQGFWKKTPLVGSKHPNAKLTADQAREIRQRIAAGAVRKHLGAEYGVGETVIYHLSKGKTRYEQ